MIMKRIIFALMTAMMLCTLAEGKNRTITENDSLGNKKRVIELRDTIINGKAATDTLCVTTYESSTVSSPADDNAYQQHSSAPNNGLSIGYAVKETIVVTTGIVFAFGFPLGIVFIVFYFRYKNRKAKYHLVEQALASGQPLPEDLFKETKPTDNRIKGINNVFIGTGLFIFLWAITGEFGLGCIGLLVMFAGFGQVVIYYTQQDKNERKSSKPYNDTATGLQEQNEER